MLIMTQIFKNLENWTIEQLQTFIDENRIRLRNMRREADKILETVDDEESPEARAHEKLVGEVCGLQRNFDKVHWFLARALKK